MDPCGRSSQSDISIATVVVMNGHQKHVKKNTCCDETRLVCAQIMLAIPSSIVDKIGRARVKRIESWPLSFLPPSFHF